MIINVIATGSSGNLYELIDKWGNSMLIEAGKPRSEYMKHKISNQAPEMCIVSHNHMDHAHFVGEFKAMIPVYVSQRKNTSTNWKAIGFEVNHGEGKSTAFIIKSLVEEKFLFFGTDFEFSKDYTELYESLKYLKVENYLIECNYNDFLFHLATPEQRLGCSRHFSDNDVVNFMRIINPKNPKIITIHGSNRLSGDTYTKKQISSKLINATVSVAVGAQNGVKNLFSI